MSECTTISKPFIKMFINVYINIYKIFTKLLQINYIAVIIFPLLSPPQSLGEELGIMKMRYMHLNYDL